MSDGAYFAGSQEGYKAPFHRVIYDMKISLSIVEKQPTVNEDCMNTSLSYTNITL